MNIYSADDDIVEMVNELSKTMEPYRAFMHKFRTKIGIMQVWGWPRFVIMDKINAIYKVKVIT